ncbi:MAG: TRAP transporter small permease subunit [Geminicoccaceae bacterium]|nr:TRAP transporter small permease subunit [Geminicoccaceae bacterium]MCS7267928.1 TRAP transporter small permease subunit [Geminicoccaceae bacterium]MCX7630358.1 TRAP transporter small permease subunit [Geminicoccaceae bacterium]MDW8124442.1 TRAP transporter small permease subunit [Geminicoccaceae bacterium]MDW8341795.1 TRAP transporter small permease subunit [Geminicoccaceae bacterium]
MRALRLVHRLLELGLVAIGVALLFAIAALVAFGVTSRKLGRPIGWYDELAGVLLAWLTWYGAALAALKRAHLGMPNLVARAPAPWRVPLVLLRAFLVCGAMALIAWCGWQIVAILGDERLVTVPWLSVGLAQSAIPVAAALFVVAELLTLPERLAEARAGSPVRDPERALVEVAR